MASEKYIRKRILSYIRKTNPQRITSADIAKKLNFTAQEVGAVLQFMQDIVRPIGKTQGRYNYVMEYEVLANDEVTP